RNIESVLRAVDRQTTVVGHMSELAALHEETPARWLTAGRKPLGQTTPSTDRGKNQTERAPQAHEDEREKDKDKRWWCGFVHAREVANCSKFLMFNDPNSAAAPPGTPTGLWMAQFRYTTPLGLGGNCIVDPG